MTRLCEIACALPEREVTNADLQRENPSWDMDRVVERTGVLARRVTGPDETAFDLSVRACEALVEDAGVDLGAIDAIVYCTQSPDYLMPGNGHLLHRQLELGDDVLVFDYNLGCSGYVYGVGIADSFARSGLASEILLVTAGTYTKYVNPRDRSTRSVLGDGAAVTRLSAGDGDGGRIVATRLCTHGQAAERVYIPAGGARTPADRVTTEAVADPHGNFRTPLDMNMDGRAVWSFSNSVHPCHVREFLAAASLELEDVDLFVFHQASRMMLDSLARALRIPDGRAYSNLERIGNVSAASIPFALRAAFDEGRVKPGDRVLLSAAGAGMSYGSVLVEY